VRRVVIEHALERALNISIASASRVPGGRRRISSRTTWSCIQWWCGLGCSSPTHTARAATSRPQNAGSSTDFPLRRVDDLVRQGRSLDAGAAPRGLRALDRGTAVATAAAQDGQREDRNRVAPVRCGHAAMVHRGV